MAWSLFETLYAYTKLALMRESWYSDSHSSCPSGRVKARVPETLTRYARSGYWFRGMSRVRPGLLILFSADRRRKSLNLLYLRVFFSASYLIAFTSTLAADCAVSIGRCFLTTILSTSDDGASQPHRITGGWQVRIHRQCGQAGSQTSPAPECGLQCTRRSQGEAQGDCGECFFLREFRQNFMESQEVMYQGLCNMGHSFWKFTRIRTIGRSHGA